jgi:hypothetical protein
MDQARDRVESGISDMRRILEAAREEAKVNKARKRDRKTTCASCGKIDKQKGVKLFACARCKYVHQLHLSSLCSFLMRLRGTQVGELVRIFSRLATAI